MDKLNTFFKRLPVTEIRVQKIKAYIQWRRKEGDADATIRRQRGHLRLAFNRSEEHTSELQSRLHLVCRLLLEKKKSDLQRDVDALDLRVSDHRSGGAVGYLH